MNWVLNTIDKLVRPLIICANIYYIYVKYIIYANIMYSVIMYSLNPGLTLNQHLTCSSFALKKWQSVPWPSAPRFPFLIRVRATWTGT